MAALTTASDINSFEELRAVMVDDVMEEPTYGSILPRESPRMIYRYIVVRRRRTVNCNYLL